MMSRSTKTGGKSDGPFLPFLWVWFDSRRMLLRTVSGELIGRDGDGDGDVKVDEDRR